MPTHVQQKDLVAKDDHENRAKQFIVKLEVKMEDETAWLTQAQRVEVFQTTRNDITFPIRNIFKYIN